MPQSPGSQSDLPSVDFGGADFGANEWLVEEMYDQYQRDPSSVDQTWVKYFQGSGKAASTSNGAQGAAAPAKPAAPAAPAQPVDHKDPTPTPAPVAKPRPVT